MNDRAASAGRVTWIGFFSNLLLTVFKLIAGIMGNSGAMVADAIHSLSDFATDIVVILSFRIVGKPADKDHDYGHGKYESLATAIIGSVLLLVGAEICRGGVIKIWGVLNGAVMDAPGWIALLAAIFSIIIKEWLYHLTRRVGRRIGSQAVLANAWHHRSDAFSSIGTMVGIGGAIMLGQKWRILDPIAAVIVSLFIIKVAVSIMSGSVKELADESLGDEVKSEIMGMAASIEGVSHPHNLRTRRIGCDIAADLHIRVAPDMSVADAHTIATAIEKKICDRFGASSFVSIHVEPKTRDPEQS
jgi:cation diffusion facilitator family transporter